MRIGGDHLHVLALCFEPIDVDDGLVDVHTPQGIELSEVWLVLSEVVELVVAFGVGAGLLEDDDSACPVAEGDVFPFTIEFQAGYYIFLLDGFVGPFVAEDLREFERGRLGVGLFFHGKSSI